MPECSTDVELLNTSVSTVQIPACKVDIHQCLQSTIEFGRTEKRKAVESSSRLIPGHPVKRPFVATENPEILEVPTCTTQGEQSSAASLGSSSGHRLQKDHLQNASSAKKTVGRITNVPLRWNKHTLLQSLRKAKGWSLERLSEENCQLWLYPACSGSTQTALLYTSERLEYFKDFHEDESRHITIPDDPKMLVFNH